MTGWKNLKNINETITTIIIYIRSISVAFLIYLFYLSSATPFSITLRWFLEKTFFARI